MFEILQLIIIIACLYMIYIIMQKIAKITDFRSDKKLEDKIIDKLNKKNDLKDIKNIILYALYMLCLLDLLILIFY